MNKAAKVTTTTVKTYRVELTAKDIREAFGLPEGVGVTVWVPGGGDWSNTELSIDDENPIVAEWSEHSGGVS